MKDNRTIIISLVAVVIAALVFFNIEMFLGQTTREEDATRLYVSSRADILSEATPVIRKGDYVYFAEIPGVKSGSGTLYIREMEDDRKLGKIVRTQVFKDCNDRKCNPGNIGKAKFKTYYNWEGEYCGEVKDLATWKKVIACFIVK